MSYSIGTPPSGGFTSIRRLAALRSEGRYIYNNKLSASNVYDPVLIRIAIREYSVIE